MNKTIVFDMDGTLANFYGVDGWLDSLINEDVRPYVEAKPLFSMRELRRQIGRLKRKGWNFRIISWGSKTSSEDFLTRTKIAKIDWLRKYGLLNEMASVEVVPYGTPKHALNSQFLGILYDDEEHNCTEWTKAGGTSVNVTQENLLASLRALEAEREC